MGRGKKVEANRMLALVRKVLNFAVDRNRSTRTPGGQDETTGQAGNLTVSRAYRRRGAHDVGVPAAAPPDDGTALARRHWQRLRAALLLRLITAQRGKEVLSLRWQDIDEAWWTIPGTVAKNGLPHRVPLTEPALAVLASLQADATTDAGYIFAGIRGTRQRAGSLDGLGVDDVRPHDFRRTAASMMTGAGVVAAGGIEGVEPRREGHHGRLLDRHGYDAEKRVAMETWARTLRGIVERKQTGDVVPFTKGA